MQNPLHHIQKLQLLLQKEYEAEKAEYQHNSEQMPLKRKIHRGLCWFPVKVGRSYYNSLNQCVVEIIRESEGEDIDHNFEYGRSVVFFQKTHTDSEKTHHMSHPCQISYVDGQRMVVSVPSSQTLLDLAACPPETLGIQLYFDETSYRTMFHALNDVLKARNNRLSDLRDIIGGQIKPQTYTFQPIAFPWLNTTQQLAVNNVLRAKDVAVVHGPPGTGKTTTLVEAINQTLRRETQVMVCAQSNMAVDWICEKLVDYGISVLRIGNPTRVNDKMLSFTYERRFADHPDYAELWSIRKNIRQLHADKKKTDNLHQKLARLRDRATEIEMCIQTDLFNEARVVACTLVGSASKLLVRQHYSTLFIDEAAQALEPACWIAIRRASRVILAGDHQQLPPTVKCYEAQQGGLSQTLMERIVSNIPSAVTLLRTQYRMNQTIMQFPSQWFYQGKMMAAPTVSNRSILDYDIPIEWIDTRGILEDYHETFVGENHGRINKAEAQLALDTLRHYIQKNRTPPLPRRTA